jgi:hypothetical protein
VAQWIRRETTNLEIAGSNPAGDILLPNCRVKFAVFAVLAFFSCFFFFVLAGDANLQCRPAIPKLQCEANKRFCSVMAITLDFESNNPGSNPGRTFFFFFFIYLFFL